MPIDARNMYLNSYTIYQLVPFPITLKFERTLTLFSRSGHSLTLNNSRL